MGDTGSDAVNGSTAASAVLTRVQAGRYDLGLNLGDLAYSSAAGTEKAYCDFVHAKAGALLPWALIPGNHEGLDPTYGGPQGSMPTFAQACAPARTGAVGTYPYDYYLDRGNVRIIMISPHIANPGGTLTYANGTPEQAVLGSWIDDARAAGRFVVVAHHEPHLTIGVHGAEDENLSSPDLATFEMAKRVDLVLSGHDHDVSRSHQLRGSADAPVVVDTDNAFTSGAGTVFAVLGTGGHSPRTIGPLGTLWRMGSGTNSPGGVTFGFGQVQVTGSVLTYTFVTAQGPALTDTFTITR